MAMPPRLGWAGPPEALRPSWVGAITPRAAGCREAAGVRVAAAPAHPRNEAPLLDRERGAGHPAAWIMLLDLKYPGGQPLPRRAAATPEGHTPAGRPPATKPQDPAWEHLRLRGLECPKSFPLPSSSIPLRLLFRPLLYVRSPRLRISAVTVPRPPTRSITTVFLLSFLSLSVLYVSVSPVNRPLSSSARAASIPASACVTTASRRATNADSGPP